MRTGSVINGASDSSLRVVEVIPSEDPEKFDILVVEQVT